MDFYQSQVRIDFYVNKDFPMSGFQTFLKCLSFWLVTDFIFVFVENSCEYVKKWVAVKKGVVVVVNPLAKRESKISRTRASRIMNTNEKLA